MKDFEFTCWEALCARLGREPTPDELREECERIMAAEVDDFCAFEWPYTYEVDGLEVPDGEAD